MWERLLVLRFQNQGVPIVAVDLDGLEEKIVIYNNTNDGRVRTTTIDYNTLTETVQLSGGFAMSKPISRDQFMSIKEAPAILYLPANISYYEHNIRAFY